MRREGTSASREWPAPTPARQRGRVTNLAMAHRAEKVMGVQMSVHYRALVYVVLRVPVVVQITKRIERSAYAEKRHSQQYRFGGRRLARFRVDLHIIMINTDRVPTKRSAWGAVSLKARSARALHLLFGLGGPKTRISLPESGHCKSRNLRAFQSTGLV